tara:strand:- start:137 stop:406 length:270 start_codon:yes stop_codon:yes gene_type:complete
MANDQHEEMDPMQDLADAFSGTTTLTFEDECKRLKEINKSIQTKLNETQRELDSLKSKVNMTCQDMLAILRDGQEYGHTEDYTEEKKWK